MNLETQLDEMLKHQIPSENEVMVHFQNRFIKTPQLFVYLSLSSKSASLQQCTIKDN